MTHLNVLPGTPQHQKILQAIVSYYENDPRILAVIVFGSLGHGNWDRYSDLDMDVVVVDDIPVDVEAEVRRLCASFVSIHEQITLLIPGEDEADVVLQTLLEISIRYHPLASTSPNIVDSMLLLSGKIERATIAAAGRANCQSQAEPPKRELDRCVRYALETDNALRRGYLWSAIELLHYMRKSIMELFTRTHHGQRAYQFFQKEADAQMQLRLGGTLPRYDLGSAREALTQFLDILTHDLEGLSGGQVRLTEAQAGLLEVIAKRD